jgi:hypothetical protein
MNEILFLFFSKRLTFSKFKVQSNNKFKTNIQQKSLIYRVNLFQYFNTQYNIKL